MNNDTTHSDDRDQRFEELCAGYVLNALDPEERQAFEQMLETAGEDQLELYQQLKSAANNLAFGATRHRPADELKKRLLEAINDDAETDLEEATAVPQNGAEGSGVDRATLAVAASFALLIVSLSLIFYALNLSRQLEMRNERIDEQQATITDLNEEIERKDELLAILESRQVNMVVMRGMEASPEGYGKIIWDAQNQQALLQVSNLPPVPSNMEYQLWLIRNNKPVSAGMFAVHDPKRDSFFKIEQIDSTAQQATNAFAVTLEPKGGMPQPTGDMYLMGNMDR